MNDEFKPLTAADLADDNPTMIAGHLRTLQREVRSGFELITNKLLVAIERLDNKFSDALDRISQLERDHTDLARRVSALEQPKKRKAKK